MENKFAKKILFSYIPLNGWYRYSEIFQLIPVPSDAPKPPVENAHYPCILEFSYDPDVYPDRDSIYWYRDIWERKRFEEMARKSENLESTTTNEQEQAIRYQTGLLRKPAIINEISRLLTLFTNFRFFDYEQVDNHWFISVGNNMNEFNSPIWGQPFYNFEKKSDLLSEFSTPVVNPANMVPADTYYKSPRDAYYAGENNQITLPQCIDDLFDTYFSLEDDEKRAYFSSCYLYYQS